MKKTRILAFLLMTLMLLTSFVGCLPKKNGGQSDADMQQVLLSTEHFKVTVAMMSYLVHSEYRDLVELYEQYSSQFGTTILMPSGKGGEALDDKKPLREQNYATEDEKGNKLGKPVTWFDHFAERAIKEAKRVLALCESAYAAGVTLTAKEEESVNIAMKNIGEYADLYDYAIDTYVASLYGEGVKQSDVVEMMKLIYLAGKYDEQRAAEIANAITTEMIDKEYEAHGFGDAENRYDVFVDYVAYELVATFTPSTNTDADAAKAENEKNAAAYDALRAKYLALSEELKAAAQANPDQYAEVLLATLQQLFFEQECDKALAAKTEPNAALSDAELAACRQVADAAALAAVVEADRRNVDTTVAAIEPAFCNWLTDAPRRAGDVLCDVCEYDAFGNPTGEGMDPTENTEYKSATSTYTVYLLKSPLHRNTGTVRSVGHILFKTETYEGKTDLEGLEGPVKKLAERVLKRVGVLSAEEMAKELILLMQEEGMISECRNGKRNYSSVNKSVFEAYGKAYTEDSNVFYNNVEKGQMVQPFEEWLFDQTRAENEISDGFVKTDYGCHVMLYVGNEGSAFEYSVRAHLSEDTYNEWVEQILGKTAYTDGDKTLWDLIA